MPKTRVKGKNLKADARRYKFKLGGRKSSTSALSLSDAELLKKYFSPSMGKDRAKIAQVLHLRGVEIVEPTTENED